MRPSTTLSMQKKQKSHNVHCFPTVHCALPYLFAIIIWITIEMGQLEKTFFFRLPIPPLTKLYKTKIDYHLYNQFTVSKRMDDVKEQNDIETEDIELEKDNLLYDVDKNEYTDEHEEDEDIVWKEEDEGKKSEMKNWEKKEKKSSKTVFQKMLPEKNIGLIHANIVNISMIVEAATESGFQYWFQTIYLLPSIILTFHNVGGNWTELFNWRVFSIILSFCSFAWAFFNIMLVSQNYDNKNEN